MAKLKLPPRRQPPSLGPAPVIETEALAEVRQRERTSRRDVMWVAVALGAFLIASLVYEKSHRSERQAAEQRAQIQAATAPALPPPGYDSGSRYPSAGEVEADAAVREARALIAANSAENATDPILNPKPGQEAPPMAPPPAAPRPFSDPNYSGLVYGPHAAASAPAAPQPAPPPPATSRPK